MGGRRGKKITYEEWAQSQAQPPGRSGVADPSGSQSTDTMEPPSMSPSIPGWTSPATPVADQPAEPWPEAVRRPRSRGSSTGGRRLIAVFLTLVVALAGYVGVKAGIDFLNNQEDHHIDRAAGFELTVPERWTEPSPETIGHAVATFGLSGTALTRTQYAQGRDAERMIALVASTPNGSASVQVDKAMIDRTAGEARTRDPNATAALASVDGRPAVRVHFIVEVDGSHEAATVLIVPAGSQTFVLGVLDRSDHERTSKVAAIVDSFHLLD